MVTSNKILTVSYGTFSCTLEGFDDSFGTMKAVAEYFRDIAADDRYFGAEPPVPDAEMLARIAQNEISKRVEVHEDQGQIVLRADPHSGLPEPQEPEITPQKSDEINTQVSADTAPADTNIDDAEIVTPNDEPEAANMAAPEDIINQEILIEESDDKDEIAEPDSVAAKLHRIRSVVSGHSQDNADEYNEDEHAQSFLNETTQDISTALEIDDATEEFQAESDSVYEDAPEEDENLAAILQTTALAEKEPADFEDQNDDTLILDHTQSDINAAFAEPTDDQSALEDDVPSEPAAMEQVNIGENTESDLYIEDESESALEDTLSQLFFDAMPEDEAEIKNEGLTTTPDYEPETSNDDQDQPDTQADTMEAAAEILSQNARVVKMKRSDYEAAVALGQKQEQEDTSENLFQEGDIDLDTDHHESTLSSEGEAELQRALAEVEADLKSDFQNAEMSEDLEADHLPRDMEGEEPTDVSRLFDEADTKRETPDSSLGRRAIQHLRAAVAATRAEKSAGSQLDTNVDDSPYRDDLATVVKPRRPQASEGARSLRPSEMKPAPLKLVAEQRIDTTRGPILPRRVSSAELTTDNAIDQEPSSEGSFEEYAKRMGATHLPDFLEAAAAYMSDVEGRVQFSRPMLMSKLQEVKQEDYSREDGLRSFGKLLREGKLKKLKGGRFTVTNRTDFRMEARNAG